MIQHKARLVGLVVVGMLALVLGLSMTTGVLAVGIGVGGPAHSGATIDVGKSPAVRPAATSVPVGSQPWAVAYDSGKGEIFVTNSASNNVSVINDATNAVVANIPVDKKPLAAVYDSGKGEVFVANERSGSVWVINDTNNTVVDNVSTGGYPIGLAYDSGLGEVFVTNDQTSAYVISDTSDQVVATIPLGNVTQGVAYAAGHGEVYTTNFDDGTVDVIADGSNHVTAIVTVGSNPQGLAYDSGLGEVFVSNDNNHNVSVISATTHRVVANVGVGSAPFGVAYDGATGNVYVVNSAPASDNVSVISDATNHVIGNLPVGTNPFGVAFDDGKGVAYVADYGSNNVSVVAQGRGGGGPTEYAVTFTESGLISGTSWSVTLNGSLETSTTSTVVFSEPNGSYAYTVGPVSGYTIGTATGDALVNGAPIPVAVAFTPTATATYTVTFTEHGLPVGTTWNVTIGSSTLSSTSTTIAFAESNGSYSYTVGDVAGYAATPSSGPVSVAGLAVPVSIGFAATAAGPFDVIFTETGLPAGSMWQVSLNGSTLSTSTTGITFSERGGTYEYAVLALIDYAPVPANGTVTVASADVTRSITFYEIYPLSLTQTGLAAGTNWSATLTPVHPPSVVLAVASSGIGVTRWSGGAATITFEVSNGSYTYSTGAPGYAAEPGNVTVDGRAPSSITVTFAPTTTSGGLTTTEWIVIGSVIVLVLVGAVALLLRRRRVPPPPTPAPPVSP
jgi:YVTN family beta-propeller protein